MVLAFIPLAIGAFLKATVSCLPSPLLIGLPPVLPLHLIKFRPCPHRLIYVPALRPLCRSTQQSVNLCFIDTPRSVRQQSLRSATSNLYYFVRMCYQIVERYSVCRCLYHRHSIDPCQRYGQRGHSTTEKTVLVGYACPDHSSRRKKDDDQSRSTGNQQQWRDSGYSSGGYQSGSTRR